MRSPIRGALSLANKVQLLFGVAVIFIVSVTLILPWFRVLAIIDQAEFESARQFARYWEARPVIDPALGIDWYLQPSDAVPAAALGPAGEPGAGTDHGAGAMPPAGPGSADAAEAAGADASGPQTLTEGDAPAGRAPALPHEMLGFWPIDAWRIRAFESPFLNEARAALDRPAGAGEPPRREFRQAVWDESRVARIYRLARLVSDEDGQLSGVIVVERRSATAAGQVFVNRLYLIAAGMFASTLAMAVFFVITRSIVFRPVRSLRDTAELVRGGSMHIRSDIRTGDEFEQLAAAFNSMLESIEKQQAQLKRTNRTLDIQVNRLEEQNRQLNEMARLKGEFLANISHELRTPLNSIIGFAELLDEIADAEERLLAEGQTPAPSPKQVAKRRRYISHIVTAGRRLLEMITELLTMARLEAGRIGVEIQEVDPAEMAEALRALIQPLADRQKIEVRLELAAAGGGVTDQPERASLPRLRTDAKKLHQIMFNFLSNAVKFTPSEGLIRIRVETETTADRQTLVRMSVIDNGPGIDPSLHAAVFEKFRQIDGGHTREHQQGTGLGLAIAKEFAEMIGGRITLDSSPGKGSAFAIAVPLEPPATVQPEDADGSPQAVAQQGSDGVAPGDADAQAGGDGSGGGADLLDESGSMSPRAATQRASGQGRGDLWRE